MTARVETWTAPLLRYGSVENSTSDASGENSYQILLNRSVSLLWDDPLSCQQADTRCHDTDTQLKYQTSAVCPWAAELTLEFTSIHAADISSDVAINMPATNIYTHYIDPGPDRLNVTFSQSTMTQATHLAEKRIRMASWHRSTRE